MEKQKLIDILESHKKWLNDKSSGERADLSCANLSGANLICADLRDTDLRDTDLRDTDLRYADLRDTNLRGATLRDTDLRDTDLRGANLICADLRDTNLRGATLRDTDLRGANLSGANLICADLSGAKNIDKAIWDSRTAFYPLQCPETGAYTAYKKAQGLIVELEIPADALRSSATGRKCRASKAKVISITDMDGNPAGECVESDLDSDFLYIDGETVEVKDFDTDRWNECAPGIYHFITRSEAVLS